MVNGEKKQNVIFRKFFQYPIFSILLSWGRSQMFFGGGGIFCAQGTLWKKGQKSVPRHFLEKFDQKIVVFFRLGARSSLKINMSFGFEGAFRQKLESVSQKLISQNSTKGGSFGSELESLMEGEGGRVKRLPLPAYPPKSAGPFISPKKFVRKKKVGGSFSFTPTCKFY